MNPDFGSIIWSSLYEPLTEDVKATIVDDVTRIVQYDPRLRVNRVVIDEFDHGLQVEIDLTFLLGNYSEKLKLEFNSDSNQLNAV